LIGGARCASWLKYRSLKLLKSPALAKALVILPVGVVEEHGAHLPLGVDSFAAEVYAAATALYLEEAGYEVVVAPTINYGVARAAIDFARHAVARTGDLAVDGCGDRSLAITAWA
jgi:creatinine amidohydrolase/Fe(II)-dependent formamide hydrolase-like protein